MANEVEICKMALSIIQERSINSLNETGVPAQICKLWYPKTRDMLLRMHNWGFANKITTLAELDETVFNWSYVYAYPTDCLKINRLIPDMAYYPTDETSTAYTLYELDIVPDIRKQIDYLKMVNADGELIIVANYSDLRIDYRAQVTDPNLFDATFTLALSHFLAANIAVGIVGSTQGRQLRADNLQIYSELVREAMAEDHNEKHIQAPTSEFVTIRR